MADTSSRTRTPGGRPPLRTTTTPTYGRGFSPHPEPDRLVRLTIDGRPVEAHAGELLIEVAGRNGIEIPSFCYYPGLTLVAACRMCLVEIERTPRLQTACTTAVTEGMVVRTQTDEVRNARKSMLEFVLTNHPLDCPVCDKGGECELQDSTMTYHAGDGRFTECKQHFDEQQWSPVVFFDRPRCILCYRCVRVCEEGMGVGALGTVERACPTSIAPNFNDHLLCDECGMCIDVCPVGALTSGMYRYRTRPWEMQHVGTICTHCADGCKTTLGIRNNEVMRGNNRDRSGINNGFLCIKGRYAGDFVQHPERLENPLMRRNGRLEPVSWAAAIEHVAARFKDSLDKGGTFGVIGSTRTTNEEDYCVQKFAREVLRTPNIDHRRSGDVVTLIKALNGRSGALATTADLYGASAVLIIGADLAQQHPFLSWQIRANWRHHGSAIYVATPGPVREDKYARQCRRFVSGDEFAVIETFRTALEAERHLVIVFGDCIRGDGVLRLVSFGDSLGIPVKYVCLVDDCNSRGAVDMGLIPGLGGLSIPAMLRPGAVDVLWIVGANPFDRCRFEKRDAFLVVQDLFLTRTAAEADLVLPAASAYEKSGTMTNVCGEVQRLRRALRRPGTKSDAEIVGFIARAMGVPFGPTDVDSLFEEIRSAIPGYAVPRAPIIAGGACATEPARAFGEFQWDSEQVQSRNDTQFTSGTLGRYCPTLSAVMEGPSGLYRWPEY